MSDKNVLAFPVAGMNERGMTLRDWFAGQAFGAIMGRGDGLGEATQEQIREVFMLATSIIYEAADAMLEARKK